MKNLKLINALLAFVITTLFGAFAAHAIGASPLAGAGTFIAIGIVTDLVALPGVTLTAISISAITTALGAYFRANKNILISDLYYSMNNEGWTVMDGVSDQLPMPKIGTTALIKPGNNTTFAPTANAIALGARILQARPWKVDLLIDPAALVKTWLGYTKQKGTRQTKIPLEQFMMAQIVKQVIQDLELTTKYRGVYNAGGTAPIDVANGLLKLIADEITASNITPTVTGAITSSNVADKLYLVHDDLGEAAKEGQSEMHTPAQVFDWAYRKFFPLTNPSLVAVSTADGQEAGFASSFMLPGTNCKIMRKAGLGASQRLITSIPGNIALGIDSESDLNNWEFQRFDRTIKVLGDGTLGIQIGNIHTDVLAVNDQA